MSAASYILPQPSLIFAEDFSGTGNGIITNNGSTHGFPLAVSGGKVAFTAAHTATVSETVANNNWVYNTTYSNNIFTVIFNIGWTDANPSNTQYEAGIWWDASNRIYYGNNSADSLSFIAIKIGNVDLVLTSTFTQNMNAYVRIDVDRIANRINFFRHDGGSTWVSLTQGIDSSAMAIPNTNWTVFFGGGAEINTRSGGDTGFMNYINAYAGQTNINPTTL